MNPGDFYRVEAERRDGSITQGPDLTDCTRCSLLPTVPHLNRVDVVGVPLVRRFGRGFLKVFGGGVKEYLQCIVTRDFRVWVYSTDGTVRITPPDEEIYV